MAGSVYIRYGRSFCESRQHYRVALVLSTLGWTVNATRRYQSSRLAHPAFSNNRAKTDLQSKCRMGSFDGLVFEESTTSLPSNPWACASHSYDTKTDGGDQATRALELVVVLNMSMSGPSVMACTHLAGFSGEIQLRLIAQPPQPWCSKICISNRFAEVSHHLMPSVAAVRMKSTS